MLDVLCIGHLDKGRIVVGGNASEALGGAVYYGGMVLLALGLRVAVVTRLAKEDTRLLDELRASGATLFPVFTNGTTGIENLLPDPASDKRRCYERGFAGTFRPEDLPDLAARLYYVGTIITDEIDLPFLRAVAARGPVALDAQGILRKRVGKELVTDGWPWADQGLPLVRYLKVDDREAAALTGQQDPRRAAEVLAEHGPQEIVLTRKEGVLVLADGRFHEAPFRPRSLAGRTGRGDTCFSAYLGRRLLGDAPDEAARFAAALTTLKLERPGPFRGSLDEVRMRIAEA
ncbi:MAG: PfkB family carbohydrate kinase [Candidatus Acetothermia bacterium]|nr:PfkB family carbohydrate kinase [Candidatus Acetothermia bacterium]